MVPLIISGQKENDDSDDDEKMEEEREEEEYKYYKEEDLLDFLKPIPKKEIYLMYVGDMEEVLQELKEEGDMSHLYIQRENK